MKPPRNKLLIVHAGTQHAWQLANAAGTSGLYSGIHLHTGLICRQGSLLSIMKCIRCRERILFKEVVVHNYIVLEFLRLLHKKCSRILGFAGNNPDYFWQILLNFMLLPAVWKNRRTCVLVLFETCGWPLSQFARHWKVPVVMDFPSISHERALSAGVRETGLGRWLKFKERQYIDYAFFCSVWASSTYSGLLPRVKQNFVHYPGCRFTYTPIKLPDTPVLKMVCIGNTFWRKGLDIVLRAFGRLAIDSELFIVGNIPRSFVFKYCYSEGIKVSGIHCTGPLTGREIFQLIRKEKIQLNLLMSRVESFGMVVIETMSLGIPNIISPRVGVGELLHHPHEVLKVEKNDPHSLAKMIHYYFRLEENEKRKLSDNGVVRASHLDLTQYSLSVAYALKTIMSNLNEGLL